MKKRLIIILILFGFLTLPAYSAIIFQSGNYYGLKDNNGNVILNPKYQSIQQLSYTPSKKVIIPMHAMDKVEIKQLDLYKIKQNNLYGVANNKGHITYACKYKNIEADSNGDLKLINTDGTEEYTHPILNAMKAGRDTLVTVVGLPVTLIGAAMIPIETISKASKGK